MISFTEFDDEYNVTTEGTYELDFLGGADLLRVWRGTVTAYMGSGDDQVLLRGGTSTIYAGVGNDSLHIFTSGSTVDGGDDDDLVTVRGGNSLTIAGGNGNDRVNFYADTTGVSIDGGEGADRFFGYERAITGTIAGGAGNDGFYRFLAGVTLAGGTGNDIYRVQSLAAPTILELAGEGTDTVQVARGLSYTLGANVENLIVLASGSGSGATMTGNALNNSMTGSSAGEVFDGAGGNDKLYGRGGNDMLSGGEGNDILDGGTGDDVMTGGAGNDTYYVDSVLDVISEGVDGGIDLVRSKASSYTLGANIENGTIATHAGATLTGNDLANILNGSLGDDTLNGLDGDDVLNGGAGNDTLNGGAGNDTLSGGAGNDQMAGGLGDDTYYVEVGDFIVEDPGSGTDTIVGTSSDYQSLYLSSNVENGLLKFGGQLIGNELDNILTGSDFDDFLSADAGNDTIFGNGGADYLDGYDGNDLMNGGDGNDTFTDGAGNDVMNGGAGDDIFYHSAGVTGSFGFDTVSGGTGADTFTYTMVEGWVTSTPAGYDTITDFEAGGDILQLDYVDANLSAANDQAFTWVASPTGALGQLWLVNLGGGQYVLNGNIAGDAAADLVIHINMADPTQAFSQADVIL